MDFRFEIGELLFKGLNSEIVEKYSANYDLQINKLVIRGPKYRIAFQGLDNRDTSHKERVLDILGKERPSQVFLSLSPFNMLSDDSFTFRNPEEIDFAMASRF